MGRPKKNFPSSSRRAKGDGSRYSWFKSGETLTLSADPRRCYTLGGVFSRGQFIETLALGCWASGTRFTTEIDGKTIEYEVSGKTMIKIKSPSL